LLSLGVLALLTACSDSNGGSATATSTFESTATLAPTPLLETPTPAPDIRQDDLTQQPGLQEFLASSGGVVTEDSISYQDVTSDGVEDAIIPISSGGEGGNIAVFVYSYQPAGLVELLRVTTETSLTVALVDDGLQVTEASFAPGDPFCCPTDLTTTTYRWNGSALAAEDQGQ
jgi:hypothetical protein